MGERNWNSHRSKEDLTQKISKSIFVTNFPDHVSARDIWGTCKAYGTVVDVYIPYKKSKAGKRFAFVRFIKVKNLDRLVINLCTIWIGSYHLQANIVRYQRERKTYDSQNSFKRKVGISSDSFKGNVENYSNSFASVLKSGKSVTEATGGEVPSLVIDDTCFSDRDFNLSLMGKIICERFKVTIQGNVHWVRAKEMKGWDPLLRNEDYASSSSDEENKQENEGSRNGEKYESDNEVDKVSESSCMQGDALFYDNDNNKSKESNVQSEDPFNIYDLLNKNINKESDGNSKEGELKYPPGFTPKETSVNEVHEKEMEATSEEVKQNSYNSVRNNSLNASCYSQMFKAGGSIIDLMDEMVKVGQTMGVGNKMHKAFLLSVIEFPLPEEVPTASEESCHCQKKREATAVKIALLLKSKRNYSYEVPASAASTATTDTASDETSKKKGRTVIVTTEDMQKRKNDVKARTTLLLSLPDEHQLRFSKYKTAQELWDAILKTFGGNEDTKKTKKNLLKQQYGNFKAEGSETLEQTFNRLQVIVSQLSDLDTMSLDDLYNHLRVYESEVQKKLKPNPQNMAFISSVKHDRGNKDVNTASVSTASTNVPTGSANI
nr:RNA-directed DNA polymerase, eukaryota, nucleotide-binding alpha-beta plait domain protein [Tanacetum cinerariifolium]